MDAHTSDAETDAGTSATPLGRSTPASAATPVGRSSGPRLTRVVYILVDGKHEEQVEFRSDATDVEMRQLFQTAAESSAYDIIKVFTPTGQLLDITNQLPANSSKFRYRVDIVATQTLGDSVNQLVGVDTAAIDAKIRVAEDKYYSVISGPVGRDRHLVPGDCLDDLRLQTNYIVDRITKQDHLSWLGLSDTPWELGKKQYVTDATLPAPAVHAARCAFVCEHYRRFSSCRISHELTEVLKESSFDNWQWKDYELMVLLRSMFTELKLHTKFYMNLVILDEWLCAVYGSYNDVPFHNFKHCFCVVQMTYAMIWKLELQEHLEEIDLLILLVAAACHDMDHPGYNNAFNINAHSSMAMRYNDMAPLENHHCSSTFRILSDLSKNPFRNLTLEQMKRFRDGVVRCIMATDMARHKDFIKSFRNVMPALDLTEPEHTTIFMQIIIKIADISNEVRPNYVSNPWLDRLMMEFGRQFCREAVLGLPQAPFMDVKTVSKPASQVGFMMYVQMPLFRLMADSMAEFVEPFLTPVVRSFDGWRLAEKTRQVTQMTDPGVKTEPQKVEIVKRMDELLKMNDNRPTADLFREARRSGSKPEPIQYTAGETVTENKPEATATITQPPE